MKAFRALIKLAAFLFTGLVPVNAVIAATALANVNVNVVSAVTASITGSVILNNAVLTDQVDYANQGADSVILNTAINGDAAKINIRNTGNYAYGMSVSSSAKVASSEGDELKLKSFQLPANYRYIASDKNHELHMRALLDQVGGGKAGRYTGSVNITVNFN